MNNNLLTAFAAVLLMLCIAGVSTASADDHHLQVADYLEFEQVSDPQISPDGSTVIYTRRWADQKTDRITSALWIMDADGSRHRFLIKGSNARWSPQGDRILFIAGGDNEKPQLFVRWMDGEGAVSQVTRVNVTPSSPKWSPDGSQIAFVAVVPADDKWSIDLPSPPEGANWTKAPRIVDRLHPRRYSIISLRGECVPKSRPWASRWCPVTHYNGDSTRRGWVKARFVRDSDCPGGRPVRTGA